MKIIFNISSQILLIVLLAINSNFGQSSVTIVAGSPTYSFYLIEPGSENNYVETHNIPSGSRNLTYKWSAVEGEIVGGSTANFSVIKWNNSNNSKKVSLELKYQAPKKDSNGNDIPNEFEDKTANDEKTVTVKYIGNVNSIFINGNETGNGGSQVLSCSTNNVTVSSSIPDTNPSVSLVYSWMFPSGWSPSTATTSINSVTVTPNASGEGNISVTVRRSDGTTSKSATIAVTRPQFTAPTVSNYGTLQGIYGVAYFNRVLCGTTTIEVTGGNGTSYDWQTTGGVSASSTTSTASISASSDGTVRVYPVSACGTAVGTSNYALLNIYTGSPGTPTFTADGDGNSFVNMCAGNSKYLVANSDRAASFDFQLLNGSASLITQGTNSAVFNTYNTGTFRVQASANNCNGSGSNTKYINVINCSRAYTVGPNPASSSLSVVYEKDTPTDLMPDNIKLYDSKMKEYFQRT